MLKQTVTSRIKRICKVNPSLNAGRFKKILLTTVLAITGIIALNQLDGFALEVTGFEKNANGTKVAIKIKLGENENGYKIDYIYQGASNENLEKPANGIVLDWKTNRNKTEAMAVLTIPDPSNKLFIKAIKKDSLDIIEEMSLGNLENVPHEGPKVVPGTLMKYHNVEYGDYIQAQFEDKVKIYKITDKAGKEEILLNKKEQNTKVTLKYILKEGETKFRVYDILDNYIEVDATSAFAVTFNARTQDGSRFVLGVGDKYTEDNVEYTLDTIETGAGQEIEYHNENDMYGKEDADDNEDSEFDEIVGVTKLKLTYKATNPEYDPEMAAEATNEVEEFIYRVITLPLVLDITPAEAVAYIVESEGDGTYKVTKVPANVRREVTEFNKETMKMRAYVNNTTNKCIVEVRDVQSGIDTIKLLEGTEGAYKLIKGYRAENAAYNSQGKLMPSVLHLFDFSVDGGISERVTAVRVTDGLGNQIDIPVTASTVANEDTIVFAQLEQDEDENGKTIFNVVAQDFKAGLWKIERDTEDENVKQVLVDFSDKEKAYLEDEELKPITDKSEINRILEIVTGVYQQYTLQKVTRSITEEGMPTIKVYDALGNVREVTFDDFAFACTYATYNQKGSLALNVKEWRGIWKVTVDIISPEDAAMEPTFEDEAGEFVVPTDSNEPLYKGEAPHDADGNYGDIEHNSPKYNGVIPNDGTDTTSQGTVYEQSEDNRPKYKYTYTPDGTNEPITVNVIPNDGTYEIDPDTLDAENNVPTSNIDNRPRCTFTYTPEVNAEEVAVTAEIPNATNEPKYKGLVPSESNKPKYKGEVPIEEGNEPMYEKETGVFVVPIDVTNEPKYNEEVPTDENEPEEDNAEEHEKWEIAKTEHDVWAEAKDLVDNLENAERAKYNAILAEHNVWAKAKAEYDVWQTVNEAHAIWEEAKEDYDTWAGVKADYEEWCVAREEYLEWAEVNKVHNRWEEKMKEHEEWEQNIIKTYTLEVFNKNDEPEHLIKTYQVPDGVVQKVTVYHTNGDNTLKNEITSIAHNKIAALQDVSELKDEEIITTTDSDIIMENNKIKGVNARASRGIKLIEYADGTEIEFHKDLPTELYINCPLGENGEFRETTVTDAVGCQLIIKETKVLKGRFNCGVIEIERTIQAQP